MLDTQKIKNYTLEEYLTKSKQHFNPYDGAEPVVFIYYARNRIIAQQYIKVKGSPMFIRKTEGDSLNEALKNLNYTGDVNLDKIDFALKNHDISKVNNIYLSGNTTGFKITVTVANKSPKYIVCSSTTPLDHFLSVANNRFQSYMDLNYSQVITPALEK